MQRQVEELELRFNEYGSHVLSRDPPPDAVSPSKHMLSPTSLRGNDDDGAGDDYGCKDLDLCARHFCTNNRTSSSPTRVLHH